MADEQQFISQSVAKPPRIGFLLNRWVLSWALVSLISLGALAVIEASFPDVLESPEYWWWILRMGPPMLIVPVVVGLLLLFVYDRGQVDEPVQRTFPIAFWGRWVLTSLGAPMRQYLYANDREETPYNRITRNWVYATSHGKRNTIGFGSQEDMERVGSFIALPATFTNTASKRGEDFGTTYEKIIGARTGVANPYTLTHFIHISAMSFGALSFRAHAALNKGAKAAGILHNTGEGGLAPCHEYGGGDLVFQLGTAKYGVRDENGDLDDALLKQRADHPQVKLIEIKLAQGAKPGKGGMLLKEKITAEISEIRGVPMGKDAHSPPRHREFSDVDGLFDFIDHVRGVAQKPVGIKMVIGHTREIESIAKKIAEDPHRGPDYIAIDGGDGGTGAAPLVLASHVGLPLKQAIAVADFAMRRAGVRDQIVLFASGKIATPIDVAVAMALGADACYAARSFLLSLGCIQALECHTNHCPTGIATQSPRLQKSLDIDAAADRVTAYAKALYKETQMLAESMGYPSPDLIHSDDIMVVTSPGHLDYLSELHGVSAYEASLEHRQARELGVSVGEMKIMRNQGDA
jgi:glutamate synthase domain-containing protein 2